MPVFRTEFKKAAMKYLAKLDRETQKSILTAIQGLSQFPPLGDLKRLSGEKGKYRLRVGGYRVIFSYGKDGEIIIILIEEIGPRGDIYK
ncbi:MAG: type II toxin-antitoxin system RelE/ParE family toxin [Clostridia bacterium]|nr:type II toxin-antitoxin system RelE/ParE family toxin [Clostridia bacterium]